jgi:CHAT domain-containing protein/predicted negative regulator of RcsB-dependent stress response
VSSRPAHRGPPPGRRGWLLLLQAACAVGALSAVVPAAAQGAGTAPTPISAAAQSALARQRDAETVLVLTAEGKLLFERDVIKLDGYVYCGRALALAEQGEFRQSIRAASRALYLGKANGNDDLLAVAQRDLAIAYSYAGLLDQAETYARATLALKANDPQQSYAPAHKVLGDVAARRGRFDEAVAAYNTALKLASNRYRPLVQVSLANAYTQSGRAGDAMAQLSALGASDIALLGPYYQRSRANALLADRQPAEAARLFTQVAADSSGADALYNQLWATEGLGRVQLAQGDRPAALKSYLETVRLADKLRAKFQSQEFKTGLFGDVQKVFDTALALSLEVRDFDAAWSLSESSRSRQLLDSIRERATDNLAGQRTTLPELRAALGPDEAVLQFHVLPDSTVVWFITRGGVSATTLPEGDAALAAKVEKLRASIVARGWDTQNQAQALYKTLMPDVDLSRTQRLFVVPHGPLHYLPFQALHDGRDYLIARSAIAVWPSAAVGARLIGERETSRGTLLGFGNPATDRDVPPLPGAEREVQQVASQFSRSDVYVQQQATKQRFKANEHHSNVMHVAAHAEVDEVDPMFSRILFASTPTEPGTLEARDIYGIDLKGVRLVTLSACESGLGKVARGDEIIGFTRSFLSAGAGSVIASLWPVSDDSTDLLMVRLYKDIATGHDLMTSMQQAQLEVRRTGRFGHPFYWAPFNVVGNGRLLIETQGAGDAPR